MPIRQAPPEDNVTFKRTFVEDAVQEDHSKPSSDCLRKVLQSVSEVRNF